VNLKTLDLSFQGLTLAEEETTKTLLFSEA
jgi:hypothetical protein